MNTNVASFFFMTQQVIPQMKRKNSPLVHRKLAIFGRLGANLSVDQGRELARVAALNALAAAQEHVGDLDRLKKLVKLSVLLLTRDEFVEHAAVADGASNLFVYLSVQQKKPLNLENLCIPITPMPLARPKHR